MTTRPVPRQPDTPSVAGRKPVKPAADVTVWGLALLLVGQAVAAFPGFALAGSSTSPAWGGMDPFLMIGAMFFGACVGLAGLVMVLMGVHRIISRNDPPPLPSYDPERQNPDGTYKNAFVGGRDGAAGSAG